MRLLPQSLFGRMMLILFSGLLLTQILSATINYVERDRLLLRMSGMQPAHRIADIVKLLDSLGPADRGRIVAILNAPPQAVSLSQPPLPEQDATPVSRRTAMFSTMLRLTLGDERPIRVVIRETPSVAGSADYWPRHHAKMLGRPNAPGGSAIPPTGDLYLFAQVQLKDGAWITFDSQLPQESSGLPLRLALTLLVLLLAVLVLSFVAVRWITRPLHVLASAAEKLGEDINRPPLPEEGSIEVKRAAHAFNKMQRRLVSFIQDRIRILAAMSHDLKTPITRMRLRAELLEDEELRGKFEKDLKEMEVMVSQTLDFMRGIGANEASQPVDIMALLESLQADNEEMGRQVSIEGQATTSLVGVAPLLKRCIGNLLDNATGYGRSARVLIEDNPEVLTLRILDEGPGIADNELEKVFEPFYRLEDSRSRETGGTGLGLAIARNIAQSHGGDIRLRNRPQGGLEAVLSLPRHGSQ